MQEASDPDIMYMMSERFSVLDSSSTDFEMTFDKKVSIGDKEMMS